MQDYFYCHLGVAIKTAFETARGHRIEREYYTEDVLTRRQIVDLTEEQEKAHGVVCSQRPVAQRTTAGFAADHSITLPSIHNLRTLFQLYVLSDENSPSEKVIKSNQSD